MKPIPKRTLGKTGVELSVLAMGGIVVMNATAENAEKWVAEAIAAGVNYVDIAPSYGNAEQMMGPALKPFRKDVFLACKTTKRDRDAAWEELQGSLGRLQTDHVDLYQMHGLDEAEVGHALGPGGAVEAFLRAKKEGLTRFIGFSSHSPQAALAAMAAFDFDTVLFPINFVLHHASGFEAPVIAEAKRRGMGILALKSLAKRRWPEGADRSKHKNCWYQPIDDLELGRLALSWAYDQGITAAVPPGDPTIFHMALGLAPDCKPLTPAEQASLAELAKTLPPLFPK